MNITAIIVAAIVVGLVGIILGVFLGVSGEKFKVEVDPREEAILEVLPGNNCGGCGYAGCSGLAAAIVKGEAPVGQCPVGGSPVAAKVGEIMGVKAEEGAKKVAFVNVPEHAIRLIQIMNTLVSKTVQHYLLYQEGVLSRAAMDVLALEAALKPVHLIQSMLLME